MRGTEEVILFQKKIQRSAETEDEKWLAQYIKMRYVNPFKPIDGVDIDIYRNTLASQALAGKGRGRKGGR